MYQENSVTETAQDQEGTQINETVEQILNTESSVSEGETNNHETTDGNGNQGQGQDNVDNSSAINNSPESSACGFKVEKPKLPRFPGDVRDYFIFRTNFKYAIDSRYNKRDAISLVHTCLQGKPLKLINGIGSDYDAVWSYLDSVYGDPRYVADVVMQDISKFKPIREGEDARFCDLFHLIKRSFNMLKEVGRPYDMDNNHMLAIIEQRMSSDDQKVWSCHL